MPDVQEELARWISPQAIAEAVLDELESQGYQQTLENGQAVWLDVLQNELPEGISSSVKYRSDLD